MIFAHQRLQMTNGGVSVEPSIEEQSAPVRIKEHGREAIVVVVDDNFSCRYLAEAYSPAVSTCLLKLSDGVD